MCCTDHPHYDRLLHGQTAAFVKPNKRDEALAARQRRFSAPGAVRRHRSEEKKAATKLAAASDSSTWPAVSLPAVPGPAGAAAAAAAAGGGKRGAPTASARKQLLAAAEPQQIIEAFLAEHDPSYQRPSSVTSGGRQSSAVYRRLRAECEVLAKRTGAKPLRLLYGGLEDEYGVDVRSWWVQKRKGERAAEEAARAVVEAARERGAYARRVREARARAAEEAAAEVQQELPPPPPQQPAVGRASILRTKIQ